MKILKDEMNEFKRMVSSSASFKKWIRCQIAIKVEGDIWLYNDGAKHHAFELVEDYLSDTKTTSQWEKVFENRAKQSIWNECQKKTLNRIETLVSELKQLTH